MKRTLLAIVAAFLMMTSAYAQRLANVRAEATLITDKMVLELGLSKAQRNGILNINLNYLNGIRSYRDQITTEAKGGVKDLSPISYNRRATVQVK